MPTAKRRIINANGTIGANPIETLSSAPLAPRNQSPLGGSTLAGINQPVISNLFIAWVEESGGSRRLSFLPGPNRPLLPGAVNNTALALDEIDDISGSVVVGVQRVGDLFNDVAVVDFLKPPLNIGFVTKDAPPQSLPAIDGARISFNDVATGDRVLMVDRTNTRWVSASSELEFEPVTSEDQTVWLSLLDDEICLLARHVDGRVNGDPSIPTAVTDATGACEVPFFGGPTEADPAWATGGNRVAFIVATANPNQFALRVFDTVTQARRQLTTTASQTIAIDPDGDAIAWVESNGEVKKAALGADLGGAVVDLGNLGPQVVPHIDIDNDLVVAQVGGQADERNDPGAVVCRDAADNAFRPVTIGGVPLTTARGPKVARTKLGDFDGPIVLAYIDVDNFQGDATACTSFTCSGGCSQTVSLGIRNGDDTNLRLARDGSVANVTSELGLRQVVLSNVFTGSRIFVAKGTDVSRQSADVAVGRVVWGDFQLGDQDVWELTTR